MADRWTLSRAGILNVYQYGDEVLEFGGGRLLLRGVNGSGKSTAMNMLLPFLLEADVRRIDAAGEQTGVLRSWMLSGREEQQPVGYLWIEFERNGEHLVCGCGIRANQSTPKVTTWWFVTPRRPGLDLHLVAGRVPLSVDQLRAEIGQHAVFTHDQRPAYRARVRAELFGGADIDQHIRLLHIVRSPRVGDRIDSDLTAYLDDALPQLSDTAIDDAAQPLENLEEHRRTVAALAATAETLDGLSDVYRSYAATEVRRRASGALRLVDDARACRRRERAANSAVHGAEQARDAAKAEVARLEGAAERLRSELTALKEQPAYREGKRLEHLRERVTALRQFIAEAEGQLATRRVQFETARNAVASGAGIADGDQRSLVRSLSDIAALATDLRLSAHPLDAPSIATESLPDETTTDDRALVVPLRALDATALTNAATDLNGAIASRRGDIDEIRRLLDIADRAAQLLSQAEQELESSVAQADAAEMRLREANESLVITTSTFITDIRAWVSTAASLPTPKDNLPAAAALRGVGDPTAGIDVVDQRDALIHRLDSTLADFIEDLRNATGTIIARRQIEDDAAKKLEAELARLRALPEPEVPRAAWQTADGIVLGQLIDFADGLDETTRLGFEAALEASGLLGANVSDHGATLRHGQLAVTATATRADRPLSAVLTVVVPDEHTHTISTEAVRRILDSISTDPAESTENVIAADGSFRLGVMSGRHLRSELAHVGAGARFAALQRRCVALENELATATQAVDQSDADLAELNKRIDDASAHRRSLPTTREIDRSVQTAERAASDCDQANVVVDTRHAARDRCDTAMAEAGGALRRGASTVGLPHTREGLDRVTEQLSDLGGRVREVTGLVKAWSRSCTAWIDAGTRHVIALDELRGALDVLAKRAAEHQPLAMELATAEDALGLGYDEVVATIDRSAGELEAVNDALPATRELVDERVGELADRRAATSTAQDSTVVAEQSARDELPRLRRMLEVPGLLDALFDATPDGDEPGNTAGVLPAVTESSDGVAELATALLAGVAEPASAASAESVRQSLRQRRDRLGANWDAGDRQPDESVPCEVEVTGPLGRMPLIAATAAVRKQLADLTSLLTAQQDQALRNLLQGLIAQEVSRKLHAARDLVALMNKRLDAVSTAHGISAKLRWTRRDDLDDALRSIVELMAKVPDLRSEHEDATLATALSTRLDEARRADPEAPYRQLISEVLDYRRWHEMAVLLERPGRAAERLTRRTALSEGEKKVVSYLPLFAAVAASCDALAEADPSVPRFVLLDDAFAKVSEDNHPKLFGLLVDLDLDFIATSERLWGTYSTVPELAITEVVRDARNGVILLERAHWDGAELAER